MSAYRREIKPWEELTIIDDYMFKLVMRHKRFCKRLIEKILNIKIRDIKYLEEELSSFFVPLNSSTGTVTSIHSAISASKIKILN